MSDVHDEGADAEKQAKHESNPGKHLSVLFPEQTLEERLVAYFHWTSSVVEAVMTALLCEKIVLYPIKVKG
jgi:hypothetical protein